MDSGEASFFFSAAAFAKRPLIRPAINPAIFFGVPVFASADAFTFTALLLARASDKHTAMHVAALVASISPPASKSSKRTHDFVLWCRNEVDEGKCEGVAFIVIGPPFAGNDLDIDVLS